MFSDERKALVLRAYQSSRNQLSVRQLADRYEVSKSTAHRWIQDLRCTLNTNNNKDAAMQEEKLTMTKLNTIMQYIDQEIIKDPFQTCKRLKIFLSTEHSIVASLELIRLGMKKLGYSRKIARYYGVAKNALYLNKAFLKRRDEYIKNGAKIYSIDETGFGRFSYQRRSGYSKKGEQLMIRKEKARVTSTSVLACASAEGWVARKTIVGGVNRIMFSDFIISLELPKGSVILLDNASVHRGDIIYDAFKQKEYIPLYVPPYSPWYNPIEKCFSIVKYFFYATQNIEESFNLLRANDHFVPFFRNTLHCYGMNDVDARKNIEAMNSPTVDEEVLSKTTKTKTPRKQPIFEKSKPEETLTKSKTKKVEADGRISYTTTVVTTVVTTRTRHPVEKTPKYA